jgi:hypothetical protein
LPAKSPLPSAGKEPPNESLPRCYPSHWSGNPHPQTARTPSMAAPTSASFFRLRLKTKFRSMVPTTWSQTADLPDCIPWRSTSCECEESPEFSHKAGNCQSAFLKPHILSLSASARGSRWCPSPVRGQARAGVMLWDADGYPDDLPTGPPADFRQYLIPPATDW